MAGTEPTAASPGWAARPLQAWAVRSIAFLAPIAGSFAFVHFASTWLTPPLGTIWSFLAWWFGLSLAATFVLTGLDRVFRRLLPLSALLKLSLVFPDETPSRFKIALRSGGADTLEQRLEAVRQAKAADTPRESAARLLELVAALNMHDRLTRGHSERVRAYSVLIGEQIGLSRHELDLLNWSALLHDIGKLEVDQAILTKPGRPSDEEWQILRNHPLFGEELTEPLREWLAEWRDAIGYHHERWDGDGYPRGVGGSEIPLAGRIVAVADVFDVMTSARSYKEAGNSVTARQEIARCAETQFDPRVVRAFLNVSLGRMRMVMGPLSWLTHAPLLGRIALTPALGSLAGAATVVATAAASGALSHPVITHTRSPGTTVAAGAPRVAPAATRADAREHVTATTATPPHAHASVLHPSRPVRRITRHDTSARGLESPTDRGTTTGGSAMPRGDSGMPSGDSGMPSAPPDEPAAP